MIRVPEKLISTLSRLFIPLKSFEDLDNVYTAQPSTAQHQPARAYTWIYNDNNNA